MRYRLALWTGLSVAILGLLVAQEQQQAPAADPPGRVARLNFVMGSVSFHPENVEDWAAATLNYPVTIGDHLWTDEQGGAELHIGSSAVRLAGTTLFEVLNLDDRATQVSVSQGFINVRIRNFDEGETFEVDTPNGAISLLGAGDYRVDVNPDANFSKITIREGAAQVTGGGQTYSVEGGQQVRFTGSDELNAEDLGQPEQDTWDEWCLNRDQADEQAEQSEAPYVGNNMIGAEDLAANGQWRSDPTYGNYWVPNQVDAGWAPYRNGLWAYADPWGWTWIDDAAWGFAPFHYGRWAMFGGVWGWVPGPVVMRPVYAPALVAFVGGARFGAAIGVGGGAGFAAWVPLGPREVYRPYYHVSDGYINRVNYGPVREARTTEYVNRGYVTVVRQDTFVGARPVRSGFVPVPAGAMARAERTDMVSVRPAHEAYQGRSGGPRAIPPPRVAVQRTVIVRSAPPVRAGFAHPTTVQYRTAPPAARVQRVGQGPAFTPHNQQPTGHGGTFPPPGGQHPTTNPKTRTYGGQPTTNPNVHTYGGQQPNRTNTNVPQPVTRDHTTPNGTQPSYRNNPTRTETPSYRTPPPSTRTGGQPTTTHSSTPMQTPPPPPVNHERTVQRTPVQQPPPQQHTQQTHQTTKTEDKKKH